MSAAFAKLEALVKILDDVGLTAVSGGELDHSDFQELLDADNSFRHHAKDLMNEIVGLYRIKHAADELAVLKRMKDEDGKTPEYLKRRDKAWKELFDAQEMFENRRTEQ